MPNVSILIPAYKPEYLELAISSAMEQTYRDVEILVGDDTPDGKLRPIVEALIERDARIRYLHHGFVNGYRNGFALWEQAKGRYIKWLFDDDVLMPTSVETLLLALQGHPGAALAFHERVFIDGNNNVIQTPPPLLETGECALLDRQFLASHMVAERKNFIGEPTNTMIDREVFGSLDHAYDYQNHRLIYLSDVATYLNCAERGPIVAVGGYLSGFRRHPGQNSNSDSPVLSAGYFEWELLLRGEVSQGRLDKDLLPAAARTFRSLYANHKKRFPELDAFLEGLGELDSAPADPLHSPAFVANLERANAMVWERFHAQRKQKEAALAAAPAVAAPPSPPQPALKPLASTASMLKRDLPGTLPAKPNDFYTAVLGYSIESLKLNTYLDNFDVQRFNYDGNDRSMLFDTNARAYYFDWFFKNHAHLYQAYETLGDADAKLLYLRLIALRLAGHHSVKLPLAFVGQTEAFAAYQQLEQAVESQLPVSGMFGKLKHFDFEFDGERYIADCLGFEYYLFRRQYFYASADLRVQPEKGDFVIDGGACTGDTALVFSNAVGDSGKVYAFDPVAEHLEVLRHNIGQFPHKNVVAMPYGLSNKEVLCEPLVVNKYSPGFSSGNAAVPLRSIDDMVAKGEIERIDFLKLDVEGAELETLLGAKESIHRFKPKMAVSLYHKPNDLFELVLFIRNEFPFYRFRLGHYTIHQEETVLYCHV